MITEKKKWLGCETPQELVDLYSKIVFSVGHASHMEHSLAAAMGMCDMNKVAIMNQLLEKDFEAALKKWPPLGGLGGYLLAGGKYTEALGTEDNDKMNLWNCFKGLRDLNNGKLVISPELGLVIQEYSVKEKIDMINKYW